MKTNLSLLFLAFVLFALLGCGSKKEKEPMVNLNLTDSIIEAEQNQQIDQFYFTLPAPGEILQFLTEEKVIIYKEELISNTANSSKYINEMSKALNLGVYTTDFAYTTFYEKKKLSNNILRASQKLAGDLNINMFLNKEFINEIEQFISNVETNADFPNEVFYQLVDNLESNDRSELLSFIITGSFIETLYIMVNIIDDSEKGTELITYMGDQKYVLDNLIEYVKKNSTGENNKTLTSYLDEIKIIFESADIVKNDLEVNKIDQGKIYISGGNTYVLTDHVFLNLKSKVDKIRNEIVLK